MEILDIYDREHQITGKTISRDKKPGEGEYLLVVHCCLFDRKHRMLIQQRQSWKDRYPGCWDVSSGGFARSGESAAQAAARELGEELGIEAAAAELRFMLTEPFSYVLDDFFMLRGEWELTEFRPQPEEVAALRWAEREEILAMCRTGEFVDYEEQLIHKLFELEAGTDLAIENSKAL